MGGTGRVTGLGDGVGGGVFWGVAHGTIPDVFHDLELAFHQAAAIVGAGEAAAGPRRYAVAFALAWIVIMAEHLPKGSVIRRRLACAARPLRDEMRAWPGPMGGDATSYDGVEDVPLR
jgi:hypothetical protein